MLRRAWRVPLYVAFLLSRQREVVTRDVQRCLQPRLDRPLPLLNGFADVDRAMALRSFRSLFYYRLQGDELLGRVMARLLRTFYPPESPLYFSCPDLGAGLYVSHGFASIIHAKSIGQDCMIAQQVTVGWSNKGGPPVIGNRVRITTGATVIGPITVGDGAVIGAHALVITDVPAGAVMGGVPAKIIGYDHIEDRSSECDS